MYGGGSGQARSEVFVRQIKSGWRMEKAGVTAPQVRAVVGERA